MTSTLVIEHSVTEELKHASLKPADAVLPLSEERAKVAATDHKEGHDHIRKYVDPMNPEEYRSGVRDENRSGATIITDTKLDAPLEESGKVGGSSAGMLRQNAANVASPINSGAARSEMDPETGKQEGNDASFVNGNPVQM